MTITAIADTEIRFSNTASPSEIIFSAFNTDGGLTITCQNTEVAGHACDGEMTLAQAIQARDFLNRHIDGLALAAVGSAAVRSSDDPTQLAAEEIIPHFDHDGDLPPVRVRGSAVVLSEGCGRRFRPKNAADTLSCGEQSPFGPFSALCPDCCRKP